MLGNVDDSAQATPDERRRNARYPFSAAIEAIETKSGTRLDGRTSDMGLGGCYVDTLNPFPVGSVLSIKISRNQESFQAKAKVTYSLVGMGMGLAFIAADSEQVKVFQGWIQGLSGEQPVLAEPEESPASATNEPRVVLSELIIALMRKGVLDKEDGNAMLRKLNR